jgi:cytochrome c-type biogenesis protein CcmH
MMLVFWIIAFLLLLAVLALILPALVRPKVNENVDVNTEKRAIFNQQFAELAQDKSNGVLDAEQYEVAKSELERRILEEIGDVQHASVVTAPDRSLALVLLLVIPLLAASLYYKLGNPDSVIIPAASSNSFASKSMTGHSNMMSDLEPLLAPLQNKLENNPEDGEGWALLARSYVELGQHAKSISAYAHATKIITDDPQLLADYADALAVVNAGQLAGEPEALVNQALKLDPQHVKALMLAATAAFDRKDYKQAIGYWERAQQALPIGSEVLSDVQASLHEAHVLLGDKAVKPQVKPAVSQPTAQSVAQPAGISGTVSISPKLAQHLDPSITVFIYARATQGPSMPLAILRTTVGNLPYAYHLDDSTALTPNHKLSLADKVVVVARASMAGDAKQQTGDLQGITQAIQPYGQKIDVEINALIP